MSEEVIKKRLLCIGAHPDDGETGAGGLAALWSEHGGVVRFVAVTDGGAGHQDLAGAKLVAMRREEAQLGARVFGGDAIVLDNQDGMLMPTLENRYKVIRAIREFGPDVIVCHRVNDYHPDHRYSGVLVQDACFVVMVSNILPSVPVPRRSPVVLFMSDRFTKPMPISPDLVFDIDSVIERKVDSMVAHECQVYEFIPFMNGYLNEIPKEPQARRDYVRGRARMGSASEADRFRDALVEKYGEERGRGVRYAEVFEVSEYGAPLSGEDTAWLLPV